MSTDEEWDGFCALIEEAWHGEFDDDARAAWRVLLSDHLPIAITGLKRLLLQGLQHRPSVSEILAAGRRDPSEPTFDEAYRLIFGRGGVLAAAGRVSMVGDPWEVGKAEVQAMLERASDFHPLIAAFISRMGVDRLRHLPLEDPQWGEKTRRDLQQAWNRHVESFDGRTVAALAVRGELAHLNPLAVLDRPQVDALPVQTSLTDGGG